MMISLHPLMTRAKKGEIALLFLDAAHFVMGCDFLGYIYGRERRFIRTWSGRKRSESGRILITWELSAISPRIDFSTGLLDLCAGDINSLTYVTYPSGLDVIWDSNDPAIATVDGSGKIEAVSSGSTTIAATINYSGKTYFQNCQGPAIIDVYLK